MKKFTLLLLLLLISTITFAQKSPRKQTSGMIGDVAITIDYGAPSVRDRTIWGELVKFDEIWRAGANENTTFSFDKDVKIGDTTVKAGKYGFFIIPSENMEWTVILNSKNDAWGSNGYSQEFDVLRLNVKPDYMDSNQEELEYAVDEEAITIKWEKVKIVIPVQ